MKKNIFIVLMTLFSIPVIAQDGPPGGGRDPQAREKIRAAHAAYITERLELTSAEAEKFWPVYREYGEKRRQLRQQLGEGKRNGLDDKALLELDLKIKQSELDLEKESSEKFQKIISPEKLIKLRQAEADFRKLLLRQIHERQRRRR